jgi:hypothetical protein
MDLKRYWQEVRALEGALPDFLWLISLSDALRGRVGGAIVEVAAAQAALLLFAKTHRVATDEEIRDHSERDQAKRRAAEEEKLRKQGIAVVAIRPKKSE